MKINDLELLLQIEEMRINEVKRSVTLLSNEKEKLLEEVDLINKRFVQSKPDLLSPNFTRYRAQEIRTKQQRLADIDKEIDLLETQIQEIAVNTVNYEVLRDQLVAQKKYTEEKHDESQIEELMVHKYSGNKKIKM